MSLQDLSRQLPSEHDIKHYFEHIQAETDRGAAVMAGALVERALEDRIRTKLHDPGDGGAEAWFEGIAAPFRTFSAKITLGRALGLYGAELETLLVVVKNVRNAFAHGMTPMDFSNPTLAEECVKLRSKTTDPADWVLTARQTFAYSCITLSRILGMKGLAQAHIDAMAAKLKGLPQSTLRDLSSGGEIGVESK